MCAAQKRVLSSGCYSGSLTSSCFMLHAVEVHCHTSNAFDAYTMVVVLTPPRGTDAFLPEKFNPGAES